MNQVERSLIQNKNLKLQQFIKEQHRLPKDQRDTRRLEAARKKAKVFKRWLEDK